jgi:TonB family protein
MTPFPRRTAGFVTLVILAATAGPVRAQATSSARLVAFRDATHLVAASRTDVEIWDLDTGRLVRALDLDRGFSEVERVLSPDGRLLALHRFLKLPFVRPPPDAGSGLHDTRLLDVDTGKEIILSPPVTGRPAGLAFSPNGGRLVRLTMQDGRVVFDIWRVPDGERTADGTIEMESAATPSRVSLSPAGGRFAIVVRTATPESEGRVAIVEARSGMVLETMTATGSGLLFSPDGALLHVPDAGPLLALVTAPLRVVGARAGDRSVSVWNPISRERDLSIRLAADVWSLAASPDGRLVVAGTSHGIQVFDITTPDAPPQVFSTLRQPGTVVPAGRFGAGAWYPGGDLTAPRPFRQVQPRYTSEAMRAKIQGTVVLEVVVREDGTPGALRVVRSLDRQHGLDDAAVAAARRWRFTPARDAQGRAVPVLVQIELEFRLH